MPVFPKIVGTVSKVEQTEPYKKRQKRAAKMTQHREASLYFGDKCLHYSCIAPISTRRLQQTPRVNVDQSSLIGRLVSDSFTSRGTRLVLSSSVFDRVYVKANALDSLLI